VKWDMRDQGDCRTDETSERNELGNVLTGKIGKGRSFFSLPFLRRDRLRLGGCSVVGSAVVLDFSWWSSNLGLELLFRLFCC
jgi:hypothetical protein